MYSTIYECTWFRKVGSKQPTHATSGCAEGLGTDIESAPGSAAPANNFQEPFHPPLKLNRNYDITSCYNFRVLSSTHSATFRVDCTKSNVIRLRRMEEFPLKSAPKVVNGHQKPPPTHLNVIREVATHKHRKLTSRGTPLSKRVYF